MMVPWFVLWLGILLTTIGTGTLLWALKLRREAPPAVEPAHERPEDGAPGAVGVDGRELEQQLRQAQRMEAIGRLAGGVAHDFNNLLNVITGYGEILSRHLAGDPDLSAKLQEILKAAQRGAALTRQLLAFSRRQVLAPRVLDLNFVLADIEKMIARLIGEHIRLVTSPDPAIGTIRADPGQIEQILLNLAVNARDAMPDGGTLKIETANTWLDERFAARHPGARVGHHVRLTVSDTGTGMDAETCTRIFEPFFTTKDTGGTGLGLATVYGIVKQSDGCIVVNSGVGSGTSFDVYLPRLREAAEPCKVASAPARESGTETILLAEDDLVLRTCGREILEDAGYHVLEAGDGVDALDVAARHRGPIHLLVTDVVMPNLNGPELAGRLAAARPRTKVLYVSGYADEQIRSGDLDPSREAMIEKPFTSGDLCGAIRSLLGTRPAVAGPMGPDRGRTLLVVVPPHHLAELPRPRC